ncbi:hypothetical protein B296_00019250, partial [Ensete ventricosum]
SSPTGCGPRPVSFVIPLWHDSKLTSWLGWFGKASCVVVSIEGEREEGDGGAELERDGDACHRYAGRGTGNPFFPGDYHHVTVIEDATAAATPQIHHVGEGTL